MAQFAISIDGTGAWLSTKRRWASPGFMPGPPPGKGAPLKFISDGFSKTMLIGEQAGLPEVIPIPTEAGHGSRFVSNGWFDKDGLWWTSWINASRNTGISYSVNQKNFGGLFSFHPGGVNASMCDGSVRFLDEAIDEVTLHRLFTRAGGDYELGAAFVDSAERRQVIDE